jgi:hypothetical protein
MKTPRQSSAYHQTNRAAATLARAELMLLGVATMNGFQLSQSRFSLACLRDNSIKDDLPPPPFGRFWCLREIASRRAVAIFLETEIALEAAAKQFGLVVNECPSDPTWSVLTRSDVIVHWPQVEGVRRKKWQRSE